MALSFIRSSGNIITEDFCTTLASETRAEYVKDRSFGDGVKHIDEEIARSFDHLRRRWEEIRVQLTEDKLDNAGLRKRWIIPLLEELAFRPVYLSSNIISKSGTGYQIPYRAWDEITAPVIQMTHSSQDFDLKDKLSRTHPNKSPHDALQLYLNTSNHRWAILTNGKKIRILRDFYHSFTKGFLEFDLEAIFENASSEHFRVLYRILHRSRFDNQYRATGEIQYDDEGNPVETDDSCLLELFHKKSRETGVKIGTHLRDQVVEAIEKMGNGFAESLNPDEFRNGKVKEFYSEILNIIYRLLFLMFAEQKGWLPVRNLVYAQTYSIGSLRAIAERGGYDFDEEKDLWEGLKITFRLASGGYTFPNGDTVNAFGGQLFSEKKLKTISGLPLKNRYLLDAVYRLSYFRVDSIVNRINYANLAIDELGSVYESLLDFEPKIALTDINTGSRQIRRGEFYLDSRGTERKTTGSYYTDSRLVAQLIDSALVPVIDRALEDKLSPEEKEKALLDLKVADIACGSGAFLIAAMEKLGERLSLIRKGDEERPTDEQLREARRDVLLNCIYGVDLNPMAVELAKFSLWITASLPDMPLSFLDHKIKCGNSLIGATPDLVKNGIPEGAYNAVTLDNPAICSELRRKVKKELQQIAGAKEPSLQYGLKFARSEKDELLHLRESLISKHQEEAAEVDYVEEEYRRLEKMERKFKEWILADVWTSAFFIQKTNHDLKKYPVNATLEAIRENQVIDNDMLEVALRLSKQYRFFHFHLEFPEVFEKGGFDCLLGNPPWEKINLEDKEFFSNKAPHITAIGNSSKRIEEIEKLEQKDPELYKEYKQASDSANKQISFFKISGAYRFGNDGLLNTYPLFTERAKNIINNIGTCGYIIPSGFFMDDTTSPLFRELFRNNLISSIFDFENRNRIFQNVDGRYRFSLLTIRKGEVDFSGSKFIFFLQNIEDIYQNPNTIYLKFTELKTFNPNNLLLPAFRNQYEVDLSRKLYRYGVLKINEHKSDSVQVHRMINMTTDSGLLISENPEGNLLPVYESKLFHKYDHRYASFDTKSKLEPQSGIGRIVSDKEKANSDFFITPRFYASPEIINAKNEKWQWTRRWYFAYRYISSSTNENCAIACIIPSSVVSNSSYLILISNLDDLLLHLANMNSFSYDFSVRAKVTLNFPPVILEQMPRIRSTDISEKLLRIIKDKVLRLTYTANDLKDFGNDFGLNKPFIWNEKERFQLQCELDAIYAHLYGLEKAEMDYILDTFPIVRRKDIDKYGTFRTKETILKLYDEFQWVKEEINYRS